MANICGLGLDDDFVRLMRNWARRGSGQGFNLRACDYSGGMLQAGFREASMPVMEGEARDTEAALATLTIQLQLAVRKFWEKEGLSWRELGTALAVHHETAKQRVEQGHAVLQAELHRRAHIYRVIGEANRERAQRDLNAA